MNTIVSRIFFCIGAALLLTPVLAPGSQAITATQVISHEDPLLNVYGGGFRLTVGRDGYVYVGSGGQPSGYIMRISRDGTSRAGGPIAYCANSFTANADGIIATADAHFTHSITIYNRDFKQQAQCSDFIDNDAQGWSDPLWVDAGASGDFYGVDQYRNRIVRVRADGKEMATYPMRAPTEKDWGVLQEFRVYEAGQSFYWLAGGQIRRVDWKGNTLWSIPAPVGGDPWDGFHGGFDMAPDGSIYVIKGDSETLLKYDDNGKYVGPVILNMPTPPGPNSNITDVRVFHNDVILRRRSQTELFERYDLATGAFKNAVSIDYEKLSATYPSDVWTAGSSEPFTIDYLAPGHTESPHWRVWARVFGTLDYQEIPLVDGKLQIPANLLGIVQFKVTPETQPVQTGSPSEYKVQGLVEVRDPGAVGTAALFTPLNRTDYGRGEEIRLSLVIRSLPADMPKAVTIQLNAAGHTIAENSIPIPAGQSMAPIVLPAVLTDRLTPGSYTLLPVLKGFTCVGQLLTIGPGKNLSPFHLVQYGDYGPTYPGGDIWSGTDKAESEMVRKQWLGFNLMVDRLGYPLQSGAFSWPNQARPELDAINKLLATDPLSDPPDKAILAPPFLQLLSEYSANQMDQMAILMGNDAGLPLGQGFDNRKPDQLVADILRVSKQMDPYPAYRGWSWASNWWYFAGNWADGTTTPAQKTAYQAALKKANDTGAWDPVLDQAANQVLSYAPAACDLFNKTLATDTQGKVTAVAAPYRNVFSYPPVSFKPVDEVDLHIQWEQMAPPYYAPHNVDFYKRPGKPAWGHPEVWNDNGTGGQIFPTLFDMIMRGTDGVGLSGLVYNWGPQPEDPRQCYNGLPSDWRSINAFVKPYGPWLTTLTNSDPVAILADGRMFKIDAWRNVWGTHFARVAEAYTTCLFTHTPAQILFTEDITPTTLKNYKAVLIVDQQVDFEPSLLAALKSAQAAGTAILADGTCRPDLVKAFRPVGVSFNQFEQDPSPAGDDSAYWRFQDYCRTDAVALSKALSSVGVKPLANLTDDDVFISERKSYSGRYLFVVNNAMPNITPGKLWRTTLRVSSLLPIQTRIQIPHGFVYDLMAMKKIAPGFVDVNLSTVPCRIYAILPAAISRVKISAPRRVDLGQTFSWIASVQDLKGKPISASIPIRIVLTDADGHVLEDRSMASGPHGVGGDMTTPLNTSRTLHLRVTELLSGLSSEVSISVIGSPHIGSMLADIQGDKLSPAKPVSPLTVFEPSKKPVPVEDAFGPHIRSAAVSTDGKTVLLNAMNWDDNLYALNTTNGDVDWKGRVADEYAFGPHRMNDGFVVQGFDYNSPCGYYLYHLDANGTSTERFPLYGLSRRLPQRFVAGMFNDRMDSFAAAPNGSWIASAGDLGIAVWDGAGRNLWSLDDWKTNRDYSRFVGMATWGKATLTTPFVAAIDNQTLIVTRGASVQAYEATSGKALWNLNLAPTGQIEQCAVSADRKTAALISTTNGGRIFVIRAGTLVQSIPTSAQAAALSPDGNLLAVADDNQVKLYHIGGTLEWTFAMDSVARFPRFSPDGAHLAACSDYGQAVVLDLDGHPVWQKIQNALSAVAWLPNGGLILAGWNGEVSGMDPAFHLKWTTRLKPVAMDRRTDFCPPDPTPTATLPAWGNADATPAPLTPNLLVTNHGSIHFYSGTQEIGMPAAGLAGLTDGKPDPPAGPLIPWNSISWMGEGPAQNYLLFDFGANPVTVSRITLVEDPAHPESWVRDTYLEYWDNTTSQWIFAGYLLSDAAIHSHTLPEPVKSTRFRLMMPPGMVGNLRLGEIVLS